MTLVFDDCFFYNADAVFISIYAVLINADAAKMPAYGTTVPYEGHNCALSVALLYRKGSNCFSLAYKSMF